MKKITLLVALFMTVSLSAQMDYEFSVFTETYENLDNGTSLNNGQTWDDPGYTIPLGFDFQIGSITLDTLFITEDGLGGIVSTQEFVDTPPVGILGPVFQDIIDRGFTSAVSLSPISFQSDGEVGSRIVKIEWNNVGFFENNDGNDFINFQMWLYEGTNQIEYRYGPNEINDPVNSFEDLSGLQVALIPLFPTEEGTNLQEDAYILSGDPSDPEFVIIPVGTNTESVDTFALTGTAPDGTVYRFTPETLSIAENSLEEINLFPNPSSDFFRISNIQDDTRLEIYNNLGQRVLTFDEAADTYDISELSQGIYIVRIQSNATSTTRRLIKA